MNISRFPLRRDAGLFWQVLHFWLPEPPGQLPVELMPYGTSLVCSMIHSGAEKVSIMLCLSKFQLHSRNLSRFFVKNQSK